MVVLATNERARALQAIADTDLVPTRESVTVGSCERRRRRAIAPRSLRLTTVRSEIESARGAAGRHCRCEAAVRFVHFRPTRTRPTQWWRCVAAACRCAARRGAAIDGALGVSAAHAHAPTQGDEIGIVTPYRGQVRALKRQVRRWPCRARARARRSKRRRCAQHSCACWTPPRSWCVVRRFCCKRLTDASRVRRAPSKCRRSTSTRAATSTAFCCRWCALPRRPARCSTTGGASTWP